MSAYDYDYDYDYDYESRVPRLPTQTTSSWEFLLSQTPAHTNVVALTVPTALVAIALLLLLWYYLPHR